MKIKKLEHNGVEIIPHTATDHTLLSCLVEMIEGRDRNLARDYVEQAFSSGASVAAKLAAAAMAKEEAKFIPEIWIGKITHKFYEISRVARRAKTEYLNPIVKPGDAVQFAYEIDCLPRERREWASVVYLNKLISVTAEINRLYEVQNSFLELDRFTRQIAKRLADTIDEKIPHTPFLFFVGKILNMKETQRGIAFDFYYAWKRYEEYYPSSANLILDLS